MYEKYEIVAWGGYLGGANTLQEAAQMALANAKLRRDIRCLAAGRFVCKFDELGFLVKPIFAPKAEWENLLAEQEIAKQRLLGTIELVCAAQVKYSPPGRQCRPEVVLGLMKDKNLMKANYDQLEYETADMLWMDWPNGDHTLAWASAVLGMSCWLEYAPGASQKYTCFAEAAEAAAKMAKKQHKMRILRRGITLCELTPDGLLCLPILAVKAEWKHVWDAQQLTTANHM